LALSITKASGTSNTSTTSRASTVSANGGVTSPTTGTMRKPEPTW
jgi:hypothetical protein